MITFAARLCDVAPDGSSALVTKGVLNATHRDSHSDPSPLVPGEVVRADDRSRRDELAVRAGSSPAALGLERRFPERLALADAGHQPAAPGWGAAIAVDPPGRSGAGRAIARARFRAVAVSASRTSPRRNRGRGG